MQAPPSTYNSGEDAITRSLDVVKENAPSSLAELESAFDIAWTASAIEQRNYSRIALQFPDELLHISVPVYQAIKAKLAPTRQLYVLADTTYGSCCVDEVAAQHVEAEVVVHYGHACLSPTTRLPVLYVFGRKPVDSADCARSLLSSSRHAIIHLTTSLALQTVLSDAIATELKSQLSGINLITHPVPRLAAPQPAFSDSTSDSPAESYSPFMKQIPENATIFYVGSESLALNNLLLTHSANQTWSYDPASREVKLESVKTNRFLMRRYAVMQKARDADVFGILIGTLGAAHYLSMIKHVRALLTRARKKTYTISVGKVNPSKLANFMEVECYVSIACPENSLVDSKDFLQPIITPFELEIALSDEPVWTGKYLLDFQQVLAEAGSEVTQGGDSAPGDEGSDPDRPMFSLATGKYRSAKRYGGTKGEDALATGNTNSLAIRNQESTVATFMGSAGGEFLQNRTFQGLEQRTGMDVPSALEQGRAGIARNYDELSQSS
ncbi:Diphthamide biosynthesis protein 2 [Tulasnella sp. UAMH 9824]|nr:Diphthamide biosynthesis protein 2 [Tulasnella sp. UAMH 9824]